MAINWNLLNPQPQQQPLVGDGFATALMDVLKFREQKRQFAEKQALEQRQLDEQARYHTMLGEIAGVRMDNAAMAQQATDMQGVSRLAGSGDIEGARAYAKGGERPPGEDPASIPPGTAWMAFEKPRLPVPTPRATTPALPPDPRLAFMPGMQQAQDLVDRAQQDVIDYGAKKAKVLAGGDEIVSYYKDRQNQVRETGRFQPGAVLASGLQRTGQEAQRVFDEAKASANPYMQMAARNIEGMEMGAFRQNSIGIKDPYKHIEGLKEKIQKEAGRLQASVRMAEMSRRLGIASDEATIDRIVNGVTAEAQKEVAPIQSGVSELREWDNLRVVARSATDNSALLPLFRGRVAKLYQGDSRISNEDLRTFTAQNGSTLDNFVNQMEMILSGELTPAARDRFLRGADVVTKFLRESVQRRINSYAENTKNPGAPYDGGIRGQLYGPARQRILRGAVPDLDSYLSGGLEMPSGGENFTGPVKARIESNRVKVKTVGKVRDEYGE